MQTYTIERCSNCSHCFKSKRSKTGYSCEVWGHDDFACDAIPEGFCHKFKAKVDKNAHFTLDNAQKDWLVDKIAGFFESDTGWSDLKRCWIVNGRSDDLRKLLREALEE